MMLSLAQYPSGRLIALPAGSERARGRGFKGRVEGSREEVALVITVPQAERRKHADGHRDRSLLAGSAPLSLAQVTLAI